MKRQGGGALMVILMIVGVLGAFFAVRALNGTAIGRDKVTASALAQARDALIGSAVMYRDTHSNEVPGHMLLPDMGSTRNSSAGEGVSGGNFGGNGNNVSALGRLPWRTLGLPVLRDGHGECLWLLVSGSYQDALKSRFMNWDTLGQLDSFTSNGTPAGTLSSVGADDHQRAIAAVFAPGPVLAGQTRGAGADVVTECGGNYSARNYVDTFNPSPVINNIVNYLTGINNATGTYTYATPKQILAGPVADASGSTLVNDRMLTISPDEVFRVIRQRTDFPAFVNGQLLAMAVDNLAPLLSPANRPVTIDFNPVVPVDVPGVTTVGSLEIGRLPQAALVTNPLKRWQDNLLYARCASGTSCLTVNNSTPPLSTLSCSGVVIFAGERQAGQRRASPVQKNSWNNYLEGPVLTAFSSGATSFTGPFAYSDANPGADVLACVTPLPGTVQTSFAADFGGFVTAGAGVTTSSATQTVSIGAAAGGAGGCFWSPTRFGLAGKRLRGYFEFELSTADSFALTGVAPDHGNGFSLQIVRGDFPTQPNTCGTELNMGVLDSMDVWGHDSFIFETDVSRDAVHADPVENHSAILLNGFLDHAPSAPGSTISTACDGTATGCRHTPANKFEESPPLAHNQRIEVHSGCNASCTVCNPPAHAAPNNYVRITAWIDCKDCSNVAADMNRAVQVPTIQRCVALDPVMNSVFFGLTGGFRSGARQQGVSVGNLVLRSE